MAAYLVRAESRPPHDPGPGSDLLESDAEKLSSTDNEEEEAPDTGTKSLSTARTHTRDGVPTFSSINKAFAV